MHENIEEAIKKFDIDALVAACRAAGEGAKNDKILASGHMQLASASFSKDQPAGNGEALLRGLQALDETFGRPAMDDSALLHHLLCKCHPGCLEWAKGHGLTMTIRHMHTYMDYLLHRLPSIDLGKEVGWMVDRSTSDERDAMLLAIAWLRGDEMEALDFLHKQLGRGNMVVPMGTAVARVLYRDMGSDTPQGDAVRHPSDSGCAWFLQVSSPNSIQEGAKRILMDEENEEYLIKPLLAHLALGVASHQAKLIDGATVPAKKRSASTRF